MMRWLYLILALSSGCTIQESGTGDGNFVPCDPTGDWLVTKLVIDLDNNGAVDPFVAGSLNDDVVQFFADGSGQYIDNLSNSTGNLMFSWSCNNTLAAFEMFGLTFDIDEQSGSTLRLSMFDSGLGVLLEVDLARP